MANERNDNNNNHSYDNMIRECKEVEVECASCVRQRKSDNIKLFISTKKGFFLVKTRPTLHGLSGLRKREPWRIRPPSSSIDNNVYIT